MRRQRVGVIAIATVLAVSAGACSRSTDTTALDADDIAKNEPVPTTVVRRGPLPTTTTTTTAVPVAPAAAPVDATLASMISQIAADPALLNGLAGLQNLDLATLFGVDPDALAQQAIDASGVQDLGALLVGAQQVDLGALALSQIDPAILARLQQLTSQIDAAAIAAVDGLNQQLIQAVATAVASIEPAILAAMGTLLNQVDPQGLGQLSADPSITSVLAVFAASVLQSNPEIGQEAQVRFADQPQVLELLGHLGSISSSLDAPTAAEVVRVGLQITPEAALSLTRLVSLLNDAEVQSLLTQLNVSPTQLGVPS